MLSIILLLGLGIFMTLLSLIAWGINVYFAIGKISDSKFSAPWIKDSGLLGDLITVDFSTVTTFVCLMTVACFTWGMLYLYRARKDNSWGMVQNRRNFPFWRSYKVVYTQFGLLGTLWGFIVAFKGTTVTNPESILGALGTSLWSSFSAIGLAFIICPLVARLCQSFIPRIEPPVGGVRRDINSITQIFEQFFNQIENVNDALEQFRKIGGVFGAVQNALVQLVSVQNTLGLLESSVNDYRCSVEKRLEKQNQEIQSQKEKNKDLENQVALLTSHVNNMEGQRRKDRKHLRALLELLDGEDEDLNP